MDERTVVNVGMSESEARFRASIRRLQEVDWDFPTQQSESAFSALHWHPCRFPSQIPAIALGRLTNAGDAVLDPFMGSATTLVEAQRLGRLSVGIDVNPVSCLMAEAKTLAVPGAVVARYVHGLTLRLLNEWDHLPVVDVPEGVQGSKWYMPATLHALRKIWGLVRFEEDPIALIGRAAFSSILLGACRETRHWGYVCDNTTPKDTRDVDARALFIASLQRFVDAYVERDSQVSNQIVPAKVMLGEAHSVLTELPSETFSALLTSPPYFGVADYVKAQRLSLEWMSIAIEPLRQQETGARSKRHRNNAEDQYIFDLQRIFKECHRVLKENSVALVVFGQSPKRNEVYGRFVAAMLELGFSVAFEESRRIAVGRRQMPSLADEIVLALRKG